MGKYMRKGRGGGGVAVMEVSQGSMGVRTRARTLALQRDLKGISASVPVPAKSSEVCIQPLQTTTSYLELRSRRLQKVSRCFTVAAEGAQQQQQSRSLRKSSLNSSDLQAKILREDEQKQKSKFMVSEEEANRSSKQSMSEVGMSDRSSRKARRGLSAVGNNSASFSQGCSKVKSGRKEVKKLLRRSHLMETQDTVPQNSSSNRHQLGQAQDLEEEEAPLEASFGENVIDHDSRERHMRETTPSSLIGDGETLEAPGSTTRPSNAVSGRRRMQNEGRRNVPTSHEMEEFFAGAEQQQQRLFTERYNYDPVNDLPLPGRYEWVRLRR